MIEFNELTYAAIITISLPGRDETASATLILAPSSAVSAGGRVKRLRECTLADLQEFADTLEAEVWETYQTIKLVDLAESQEARIKVTILNEKGERLPSPDEWLEHVVVLPESPQTAAAVAREMSEEEEPPAEEQPDEPSEPDVPEASEPAESTAVPVVEESEAAVPEPEAPQEPAALSEPEAEVEAPVIVPSHPEIRIAGKRRPLGYSTWAAVDILINEPTFRDTQAHALSSPDREVAGVLVGPIPEKQPDGRYLVHITDSIIAKHTRMHGASVTYTPESWRYLNDKLAERYPDESAMMVGWYHTHPGFGIFLSSMDQFIHQNFFTQTWHVALVLDPLARKSGFFCWDRGKTQVKPYEFPWPMWAYNSW